MRRGGGGANGRGEARCRKTTQGLQGPGSNMLDQEAEMRANGTGFRGDRRAAVLALLILGAFKNPK